MPLISSWSHTHLFFSDFSFEQNGIIDWAKNKNCTTLVWNQIVRLGSQSVLPWVQYQDMNTETKVMFTMHIKAADFQY